MMQKGGERMAENDLKQISGKKIRRQYFTTPLLIFWFVILAIVYTVFVISLCMGKLNPAEWPSTLWTSLWVGFCFSLPLLILRVLNKHFFGSIICVLTEEGIHHSKGMVRWETIEKIEYALDAKKRYKSDNPKASRIVIYTTGGKHVILNKAPLSIVSQIKKYRQGLDVEVTGALSRLSGILVLALILAIMPFYVMLLISAPTPPSEAQFIVLVVIAVVLWIPRNHVFCTYAIPYRFWRRILPRKRLSYIVLGCYYISYFAVLLILVYFPNWVVVVLLGIYLGVVQPPIPSRRGHRNHPHLKSYDELYELYITRADYWEKQIEKRKKRE